MPFKEAFDILQKSKKSEGELTQAFESDDMFYFNFDNDEEVIETVNKKDKTVGFVWIWDFLKLMHLEGEKIKDVNISEIRAA